MKKRIKPLTAAEARRIAGVPDETFVDEAIARLCSTIEELAKKGQRKCRTGYDHKEDTDLWINGGYGSTPEWKVARKKLEGLGYKVSFYYQEMSIAVDMYTLIEW